MTDPPAMNVVDDDDYYDDDNNLIHRETQHFLEMEVEHDDDYDNIRNKNNDTGIIVVPTRSNVLTSRVAVLGYVAFAIGCVLLFMNTTMTEIDGDGSQELSKNAIRPLHASHWASFGGINNIAHPGGAKAAARGEGIAYGDGGGGVAIPVSNVGHAIRSLNRGNIVNHWGHYVHDEHRSPYASHLYDKPKQVLEEQQAKYVEKMERVREEWGAWDFKDPSSSPSIRADRPFADFSDVSHKDMKNNDFPVGSWQTDEEYVAAFLKEARSLLDRVTEGVYAEYGAPHAKKGTAITEEERTARDKKWAIHVIDKKGGDKAGKEHQKGLAVVSKAAFDGLVRKLLHATITHDEFYVVLAGHSAAAGHGNNFQQNRVMTFHRLMEPVFDKLGVRLVTRNMGMGGVGTLQFTLAGGDLYGEGDLVEWDSGMTEKGNTVDLFNKQAILSGERVPVLITPYHFDIEQESDGMAMMGEWNSDMSMFPETNHENADKIAFMARWIKESNKDEKYNAVCWEDRTDFEPPVAQDPHPGSQVSWHPGFRFHQFEGRRLALLVLKAYRAALDQWEESIRKKEDAMPSADRTVPLPDESDWHVGDHYKQIRDSLRTHGGTTPSACEKAIPWIPRICRIQLHGYGMWTPRATEDYDLLKIIQPAPNGYIPFFEKKNNYDGFDLLPYKQALPDDAVDAHLIAIATTTPPPLDMDHMWSEEGDGSNNTQTPQARRWLREASMRAYRRGMMEEVEKDSTDAKPATSARTIDDVEESSDHQKSFSFSLSSSSSSAAAVMLNSDNNSNSSNSSYGSTVRKLSDSSNNTAGEEGGGGGTTTSVVPGRGWETHAWTPVKGFCDGSAQSECKRSNSEKCLMYGASDNHMDVHGNSLSGWLVFNVPNVKEGIILIRMEWWCGKTNDNELTLDWTEVNDGKTTDTTPWNETTTTRRERRRILKPKPDDLVPKDFLFDIWNNKTGVIRTMDKEEWLPYIAEYSKNCAVWPLLNDENFAKENHHDTAESPGETVQVAVRFRVESMPKQSYCISHLYYA